MYFLIKIIFFKSSFKIGAPLKLEGLKFAVIWYFCCSLLC